MSKLFRASLLVAVFFGINKIFGLARQAIIVREYGISPEIDAFNVANNVPDLIFSLISGGALAMAFIPVLTEYIDTKGRREAWLLFSRVANLVFLSTAVLSVIVAVGAEFLVGSEFGVAPGFTPEQQKLTVDLMRLNLIATLIFSLRGLVMAALQSHKRFLLTAVAPILYNVGQIIGVVFFNIGVYGLAYGVIFGALLHLFVQLPGIVRLGFHWRPSLGLYDIGVRRVMRLMGPRILTVLFIQIIFLTRDNLASRLDSGSVSALTYAYFIMQVPQTLIGTALGTVLLPTLSHFADQKDREGLAEILRKVLRVMFALTVVVTVILSIGLDVLIKEIFGFTAEQSLLLSVTTKAFMIGLLSQCLLEIVTRAYYAQQDSNTPFAITLIRMLAFIVLALVMLEPLGVVGIALADTLSVSLEVIILLVFLRRVMPKLLDIRDTVYRTIVASAGAAAAMYGVLYITPDAPLVGTVLALIAGSIMAAYFIRKELRMLVRL